MKAAVCHKGTATVPVLVAAVLSWNGGIAHAQQPVEWRKVGGTSVALDLSGPATGAVARVWYGPNGATLYAETRAGKVFRSTDLETWSLAVAPAEPAPPAAAVVARLPESGSRAVSLASDPGAAFALGQQLYRSDDGGRSWTDLTGFKSSSVVGGGLHDIAVAAGLRDRIVVANDYGSGVRRMAGSRGPASTKDCRTWRCAAFWLRPPALLEYASKRKPLEPSN